MLLLDTYLIRKDLKTRGFNDRSAKAIAETYEPYEDAVMIDCNNEGHIFRHNGELHKGIPIAWCRYERSGK